LAVFISSRFPIVSPSIISHMSSLLVESWHRIENQTPSAHLADCLAALVYKIASSSPLSVVDLFVIGEELPDQTFVAKRFNNLYERASNTGKLLLLNMLLRVFGKKAEKANVLDALLGSKQVKEEEAIVEIAKRIDDFVSSLNVDVEMHYTKVLLYPRLAPEYAYFGKIDKVKMYIRETMKALRDFETMVTNRRDYVETVLRPHLKLKWIIPDLDRELDELRVHAFHQLALAYMLVDMLKNASKYAQEACKSARKLGNAYYEIMSCGLRRRIEILMSGLIPYSKFAELWLRALQKIDTLDAELATTTLSDYIVALVSVGRLTDVNKLLEEWNWMLELQPSITTLTYGVLSLFDQRYLDKAMEHFFGQAKVDLQKLADVLHDAVERGVFDKGITIIDMRSFESIRDKKIAEALDKATSDVVSLFVTVLLGLAHCERSKEWGLKLARAAAQAGSQLFKDRISSRLFGELYNVLEGAKVGKCITDEVLRAVYKLYYAHV